MFDDGREFVSESWTGVLSLEELAGIKVDWEGHMGVVFHERAVSEVESSF